MIYVYLVQYNEQGQELDRVLVGPAPDQASAEALMQPAATGYARYVCYEQESADPVPAVPALGPAKLPNLPPPLGGGK